MKTWKKVKFPPLVKNTIVNISFIKLAVSKLAELDDTPVIFGPYSKNNIKALFALAAGEWRDLAVEAATYSEAKEYDEISDQWDRLRRQL